MPNISPRLSLLGIVSGSLFAAACGGGGEAGVAVSALTSAGQRPVAADAQGLSFTIDQGLLHLRHIELDLPSGTTCADIADRLSGAECDDADDLDDEAKIHIAGPFVVDMIAGTSTPSLAGVTIPAGTYRRIDLRVDDGLPEQGLVEPGSPLDDNALAVIASFDDGGTPAILDLRLNFDEDIRIEQPGGVAVAEGDDLIARFAATNWLAGVDLAACAATLTPVGGRYVIDDRNDGACAGIEDLVKNAMKESGDLVDSDDDSDDD
ncbi:MAG: hypothetical protein KBG48_15310 [Kofleriaceae bacterium]|nr:hypothetical protein [Kofleriaceae bacterium]MBP9168764.1 hypothetical protein [Kofleriaceae bacterium]MBP9860099.1 hypothetical protein [Kofleriaceae bacterium]